jgi:O-antigen/teichoic acid export membrane protein
LSDIRVTYSGLLSLVIGLVSVFTGLFFVLMVTRRLSPEEFGTWSLIGTMISYFLISERIISFWSTRQIARNEDVGKTSIISSSVFSIGAVPFYLALIFGISETSNAQLEPMILSALLMPVYFISLNLEAINVGHKPQAVSYSLLIFEILKIPFGLGLVVIFDLGIQGAIIAILLAYIGRIILQLYFARSKIKGKFQKSYLIRWLKLSWLPTYSHISKFIQSTDVLIYTLITGSVLGVAYYTAALSIAKLVEHALRVSGAVYPKLLAKGSHDYIRENFTLVLYFSIPLLGISVILSRPGLFALNPIYEPAYFIAIILSIRWFFFVLRAVLDQVLAGIDTVDVEKKVKFKNLLKSNLFLVNTTINIQVSVQIALIAGILLILNFYGLSEIELTFWWALAVLVTEIPFFIYRWIRTQEFVKLSFPIKQAAKYSGATFVFIGIFLLTSDSIIKYEISIYDFLPGLILQLAICIGIYLLITYLIDQKTRILFKGILNEIIHK